MKRQSQNTKQVGVLQNIQDEEFWRGVSETFSETERLFALTERREEINQNGQISPSDGERGGSAEYFDAMVSASAKIYLLLSKCVCHFFLWFDQFILA